ncbi:unnamed protein product, partial [Mycena citricolor]
DSDILHFDLAGTSLVVLCSASAAADLLDKQSAAFSDRARRPMVVEVMGWDFSVAAMKYGDKWRAHRRLMHQVLNEKAAVQYRSKQLASAHEVLRRLMTTPEEFMDHFRHWAAEIIMSTTYGITIAKENDFYVDLAHAALRTLSVAGVTGTFWVDFFPALQHIPEWFPGAKFKRDGAVWRKMARQMVDVPFAETKRQMASPTVSGGDISLKILHRHQARRPRRSCRKACARCRIPHSTMRKQSRTPRRPSSSAALTPVCPPSRLLFSRCWRILRPRPEHRPRSMLSRRASGSQITTTRKTCHMSWQSCERLCAGEMQLQWVCSGMLRTGDRFHISPLAIPHFTSVDGEYKGFRIPAKSLVIGNTWAITHDESVYPDPDKFNPDRFLLPDGQINPDVPFPDSAFGFGRRVCPGKPMALASLYIAVASILSSFKISKARDINGNEIEPTYKYLAGFISAPAPFECSILPRSDDASSLIMNTVDL